MTDRHAAPAAGKVDKGVAVDVGYQCPCPSAIQAGERASHIGAATTLASLLASSMDFGPGIAVLSDMNVPMITSLSFSRKTASCFVFSGTLRIWR